MFTGVPTGTLECIPRTPGLSPSFIGSLWVVRSLSVQP